MADRRQRFPEESYKARGSRQKPVTRFPKALGDGRISKPENRDLQGMNRSAALHGDAMQSLVGGDTLEEHDYKRDE